MLFTGVREINATPIRFLQISFSLKLLCSFKSNFILSSWSWPLNFINVHHMYSYRNPLVEPVSFALSVKFSFYLYKSFPSNYCNKGWHTRTKSQIYSTAAINTSHLGSKLNSNGLYQHAPNNQTDPKRL